MRHRSAAVHRVAVTDEVATARPYDYADSFEAELPEPDLESPQTWVLAGLNEVPALVDRVASWLGVDSEPNSTADRIDGWRVVESTADVVQLEQTVPLMDVVLVGRRIGSSGRRFTSILHYRRPLVARLVWAVVGLGHRQMARRLVAGRSRPASSRALNGVREESGRAA